MAEKYGYLSSWFRRLSHPVGRLIPLKPGLNVIYGRNGAGKTQLMHAIDNASKYQMSPYEGFILRNPRVAEGWPPVSRGIFDRTSEEILDFYSGLDTEDVGLGELWGFIPESIVEERRPLVLEIITEILKPKRSLLTRSPGYEEPSCGADPNSMNDPEAIQMVPILLPSDEAPITRAHAKDIHDSYLALVEKVRIEINEAGSEDAKYIEACNSAHRNLELWLKEWSWSPLLTLRNVGFVEKEMWGWEPEAYFQSFGDEQLSPIFLPHIWMMKTVPAYEEFPSQLGKISYSFSLTREKDRSTIKEEENSIVSDGDIGLQKYSKEKMSAADKALLRERLQQEYLIRLRGKVSFLPGLRAMRIVTNRPMSTEKNKEVEYFITIGPGVIASGGSDAELRWFALARAAEKRSTQWVVIDEPESGLHRTAEAELAEVLASPAWNKGSVVVVATHSPEFLDLPNAHVLHIDAGKVRELTSANREELAVLGLRPADLLTQIRTFLLVEGEHERLIFEALFSEELRRMRCKIIVARGGKNMKDVFESQMIFEFTDAKVISLLDNIDAQVVTLLWEVARKVAGEGKEPEAGQYVRSGLPGSKSGENKFLSEFLSLALKSGQHERVEVWGLSKGDILYYFSPSDFGLKIPFKELVMEHQDQFTQGGDNFKTWARKKYRADFSDRAVVLAAESLDHIPDDFVNLLMQISSLSRANSVSSNE